MNEEILLAIANDYEQYLRSVKATNIEANVAHFVNFMRQSGAKIEQRKGSAFERNLR